ncbi:unnamed protein product [Symbiodinium necroappetens]|uniref:PROP1-like PPR domain-containing protein n=1 Tax=Symbiodinium necroappetens TaxID=1628268 RepID=A0A812VCJ8_9DINO|nr:unnamed protein product [Symbiodinium necroappetens]
MAAGRVATCVLVFFLWPLAVWHVPGADWTFVSPMTTGISSSHTRQSSPVVRRVREKKVRFEGKKQAETRRAQVRHKHGAPTSVLLDQFQRASREGKLREAENIFHLLCLPSTEEDFRVGPQAINGLIAAAARCGKIDRAKYWFDRLFDLKLDPTVEIFTSLITAGSKYGNLQFAEEYFDVMAYYQIEPTVETYGAMIKAAANARQLPSAEKWFYAAQEAGLQPNEILFKSVMQAAAKVGNVSRAQWWFEAGCKQTGMTLDTTSCTILIFAAKESHDLDRAESFYKDFVSVGLQPNFQLLSALVAAAANAQQPQRASLWLDEMISLGLQPNHQAYASLMNAWFKAANCDKVLETLEIMKRAGFELTVVDYTMAIQSVGMAGRPADAEHLLRDMLLQKVNLNERTLRTLASAVGSARYLQLQQELNLDLHLDKTVDQSRRQIAKKWTDIVRHTDEAAVKARMKRGRGWQR